MPHARELDRGGTQELIRQMSAGASDVVDKVIPFANDDVPKYLAQLRRFEEQSKEIEILIR